jgi:diguanylate cyclase (GGDEF)-like protein
MRNTKNAAWLGIVPDSPQFASGVEIADLPADSPDSDADVQRSAPTADQTEAMRRLTGRKSAVVSCAFVEASMQEQIEMLKADKRRLESALARLEQREAASRYLAYHDGLTALPNRRLLVDRFLQATARADRQRTYVALLFLDLDGFKRINDEFGHSVGDAILQAVAGRIQAMLRATDTACRYGGDEFVLMLPDLANRSTAADLAEKIRVRIADPYPLGDGAVVLQSSVGIAMYPDDGIVWEALLRHADAAMYHSKLDHARVAPRP